MSTFDSSTDATLTTLLREGNERAFCLIYDRYWSVVYSQVDKILRDKPAAQDVVQDIFSKLWNRRKFLKPDTDFRVFLYVSARNHVFNLIAQHKNQQEHIKKISTFMTEVDLGTLVHLEEKDLVNLLEQELQALPPKMREIFRLSRIQDLSHKQIAEKLHISEQTVKKQVQNALKIL